MKHPVIREWAVIIAILAGLVVVATRYGWLTRVDQSAYDLAIGLWQRPALAEIVIVGIDEASLAQLGRWPWKRVVHAALLDRLAATKPAVIAFDVILTEPDKQDSRADPLLATAIKNAGRVLLPVIPRLEEGMVAGELLPATPIREAALGFGHIQSQTDADGVLRQVFLFGGAGGMQHRLLGFEALVQSGTLRSNLVVQPPSASVTDAWQRAAPLQIPYAGPPGHFAVVPYINVLRGDVAADTFTGKIVLVGVTASGLGDEYPTPVSGTSRAMSGIEIHANVLQALAEGVQLRAVTQTGTGLLALFAMLVVMCGYLWLTPRQSLALAVSAMLLLILAAAVLFRLGQWWISPTLALCIVATTYPLWSWRKLEATQRYFDAEMARLAAEPEVVPLSPTVAHSDAAKPRTNWIVPDVIERRIVAITAATERLRQLKRFVAETLESLPIATLVVDDQGKVLLANSEALGYFVLANNTSRAVVDQSLVQLLAQLRPAEIGSWDKLVSELIGARNSAHSPITVEAKTVHADPGRDCVVQFATLNSALGVPYGYIVTITDITPLRESERRRDEALRFLSHDMRSPQASIITLLEMVREDPDSIAPTTLLDRIGRYAHRTLNLADDFLRLAKAERAKAADFNLIDLAEIARDASEEIGILAASKSIALDFESALEEAYVLADRDLLTRAIINLLSNAVKYSPAHTKVKMRLGRENHSLRLEVCDQGYGIAPENLPRLFQRFERITQAGQPPVDGIGLGLVFVKTVIERAAGHIEVASQIATQPGEPQGTTFTIYLPLADESAID